MLSSDRQRIREPGFQLLAEKFEEMMACDAHEDG